MKKTFTLLLVLIFTFQINAQNQKPLIIKKTATWCPFCGTYGWDFMEEVMVEFQDNAVVMGVHFSGDLQNDVAIALSDNFGVAGQPKFFFNNIDLVVNPNNVPEKIEELKNLVADFNAQDAPFSIDIAGSYNNTISGFLSNVVITPNITTVESDIYVGVYLLENDVRNNQASIGIANHPRVLRAAIDGNNFGVLAFSEGDLSVNEIYSGNYAVIPPAGSTDDLDIAVVIYSEAEGLYDILQAEILTDINLISNNDEIENTNSFNWLVKADKQLQFNVELSNSIESGTLRVYNQIGQNIIVDQLDVFGTHISKTYDLSGEAAGTYIISFEFEGKQWTERFILAH